MDLYYGGWGDLYPHQERNKNPTDRATPREGPGDIVVEWMSMWQTQQDVKRDTDKEQNRVFSESLNSRGHTHQEMFRETPDRGPWGQA